MELPASFRRALRSCLNVIDGRRSLQSAWSNLVAEPDVRSGWLGIDCESLFARAEFHVKRLVSSGNPGGFDLDRWVKASRLRLAPWDSVLAESRCN